MTVIDVDFEVFKELTVRRRNEAMTENEVIRELLGMTSNSTRKNGADNSRFNQGNPWVVKGVTFQEGTEFRATYKGQLYQGLVKNGALVMNGQRYASPSAAAVSITGNPVNGWRFWECLRPGENKWKLMASYRR